MILSVIMLMLYLLSTTLYLEAPEKAVPVAIFELKRDTKMTFDYTSAKSVTES